MWKNKNRPNNKEKSNWEGEILEILENLSLPETFEVDVDKLKPLVSKEKKHKWVQQGSYLVCISCELEHATWIGINFRLVGFDKKGNPKLKKIK